MKTNSMIPQWYGWGSSKQVKNDLRKNRKRNSLATRETEKHFIVYIAFEICYFFENWKSIIQFQNHLTLQEKGEKRGERALFIRKIRIAWARTFQVLLFLHLAHLVSPSYPRTGPEEIADYSTTDARNKKGKKMERDPYYTSTWNFWYRITKKADSRDDEISFYARDKRMLCGTERVLFPQNI